MTSFQIQSRSKSDPTLSDIVFKNKLAFVWTTLKYDRFWSDLFMDNPFFSPVTSSVCPSPSLRMPTRSSSMGNLRENQLDEYEGMDCER